MRVALDFIAPRPRPWLPVMLLVLLLAVAARLLSQWYWLEQESARLQRGLASAQQEVRERQREQRLRSALAPAMAARMKEEQRVSAALRYPWNVVLSGLEQADMTGIVLVSFSHDQAGGCSHLQVDARDMAALSGFVDSLNLGRREGARWHVVSYQTQQQATPVTLKAELSSK